MLCCVLVRVFLFSRLVCQVCLLCFFIPGTLTVICPAEIICVESGHLCPIVFGLGICTSPTVNYFGHWVWCGCRRLEIVSQTWKATHANTCTSMLRIPPMLLQVYISLCSPTDAPKMSTSHGVFVWCLCSFRLVVRLSPFHY